ncbi:putative quinol monooxygenase [Vibrio owensii]|uniref:putative quinol monooxygenase n=1 Tax=Vibrio owensii TaxID=696485 RepID=UPI003CE46808
MIIVTVTGKVKPQFKSLFIEHMAELAKVVRAEDGCITYQQNISADDENKLFLYEEWQSEQQLQAHLATTHMTEHFELAQPWFDSVEMKTFEATETQA